MVLQKLSRLWQTAWRMALDRTNIWQGFQISFLPAQRGSLRFNQQLQLRANTVATGPDLKDLAEVVDVSSHRDPRGEQRAPWQGLHRHIPHLHSLLGHVGAEWKHPHCMRRTVSDKNTFVVSYTYGILAGDCGVCQSSRLSKGLA